MNRYKTSGNYNPSFKPRSDDKDINRIQLEYGGDGGTDREDKTTVVNPKGVGDYKLQPAEARPPRNSSLPGEDESKHTTSRILFTKR